MLRPGTCRPQSRCDIQAMVPGFQSVCLGSALQGDASQRTKAMLSRRPMRGRGHVRQSAQFMHVIAIERGGNIILGDTV
jgi:hypothetical protein